jgi:hypothetical protein
MTQEALQRQKTIVREPETVKDYIKGRNDFQYLIKMMGDPDHYQQHKAEYLKALEEAQKLFR